MAETYTTKKLTDASAAASFDKVFINSGDTVKQIEKAVFVEIIKEAIGSSSSSVIKITLLAANWVESSDGTYHTQSLTIDGATENSRIDLQPTPEQIIQLMNDEISMFIANDDGNILAYSVNGAPSEDMTMEAILTEVV